MLAGQPFFIVVSFVVKHRTHMRISIVQSIDQTNNDSSSHTAHTHIIMTIIMLADQLATSKLSRIKSNKAAFGQTHINIYELHAEHLLTRPIHDLCESSSYFPFLLFCEFKKKKKKNDRFTQRTCAQNCYEMSTQEMWRHIV